MDACFHHPDVAAAAACPHCAKRFCTDCLLLHTSRKLVICRDCFRSHSMRLEASISRRRTVAFLGLPFGVLTLLYGLGELVSPGLSSLIFLLIGLGCLIAAGISLVRIRQEREFLIAQSFTRSGAPAEGPGVG